MKWRLLGYDAFEGGPDALYGLGEFASEADAQIAARKRLLDLEITQPSGSSGGQGGIQDQVFIVRPDGTTYRF